MHRPACPPPPLSLRTTAAFEPLLAAPLRRNCACRKERRTHTHHQHRYTPVKLVRNAVLSAKVQLQTLAAMRVAASHTAGRDRRPVHLCGHHPVCICRREAAHGATCVRCFHF